MVEWRTQQIVGVDGRTYDAAMSLREGNTDTYFPLTIITDGSREMSIFADGDELSSADAVGVIQLTFDSTSGQARAARSDSQGRLSTLDDMANTKLSAIITALANLQTTANDILVAIEALAPL